MTFAPKRGAFIACVGFPVFLVARTVLTNVAGRDVDWQHNLLWAGAMALTFGMIATFTRLDA